MHEQLGSEVLRGDVIDLEAIKARVAEDEYLEAVVASQFRAQRGHCRRRVREQAVRELQCDSVHF